MKPGLKWGITAVCVVLAGYAAVHGWQVSSGQQAFKSLGCANCHLAGGGPNLSLVKDKYSRAELVEFIHDPEFVYKKLGRKPLNYGYAGMHKVKGATDMDIGNIATYLRSQ